MTIEEAKEELNAAPRPEGFEALVQALAEQAFAKQADGLSKQAARLSERVALLEGREKHKSDNEEDGGGANTAAALTSNRLSFEKNDDEESAQNVVHGLEEAQADNKNDISRRFRIVERRLDQYDDEKAALHDLRDDIKYKLSESTFSILITHHALSIPFAFAVFSGALSIICLGLTLASSISKGTKGNQLGMPAGVTSLVRAAQFFGAIIGVLMEDEIPQGLQLIANGAGHNLLLDGRTPVRRRVIIMSIFRLIVGYLFLSSLFINIAQSSDVLEIFYDVLALEFVENIDDTAFALAKRGFFGKKMLIATNQMHTLEISELSGRQQSSILSLSRPSHDERRLSTSGVIASNKRANLIVRFIYFLNATIVLVGLGYITAAQKNGKYRCQSVTVKFSEEIWEKAHVDISNGSTEERLLIYPSFNGIYKEDGTYDGYPRFVEQNKNDGNSFGSTVRGAEIVFCHAIKSWVFRHPNILTFPNGKEQNECSWLWKSPETEDYDLTSTSDGVWDVWIGEVKPFALVSITCNECKERSDCNYQGSCHNNICECDDTHFGNSCEFEIPCPFLATEKAHQFDPKGEIRWNQDNPIREILGRRVYNRPVYIQEGLSGEPYDLRLYKLLEKERTSSPSGQPSGFPSFSFQPTPHPTGGPSLSPTPYPTLYPTDSPTPYPTYPPTLSPYPTSYTTYPTRYTTTGSTPTAGSNKTLAPTPRIIRPTTPYPTESIITPFPTEPLHTQIDRDTAPDFEDWDDFFEKKSLHNLDDILEDYSVVISYSGSRFYGTIIEPDAKFDDLFPRDYHAFWSQSFNVNRTFIISDTTFNSNPVGVDFFEMRRRIDNLLNPNVQFSYSPFGVQIPLMSYQGAGFFHCLDVTPQPSISPSSSPVPTTTVFPSLTPTLNPSVSSQPSTSISPTDECQFISVNIVHDYHPEEISWTISSITNINQGEKMLFEESDEYFCDDEQLDSDICPRDTISFDRVCLKEGAYFFEITDSYGDGIGYNLTYHGGVTMHGAQFYGHKDIFAFRIPFVPKMASASP